MAGEYKMDLPAQRYELSGLELKLAGAAKGQKNLQVSVTGGVAADLAKQTLAADLHTRFDESSVKAKLGLVKFSPPAYTFDVDIDRLNLDRYMPKEEARSAAKAEPAKPGAQQETPVDLSALKGLNANGRMQIGRASCRERVFEAV